MFKKFFRNVRQGSQVLAIVSLAFLAACQTDTVNTVEASIDSLALTALTSQKVLLKHPCTETVTTLCADQDLLKATKGARLILITSLQGYWTSADAYKKALAACKDTPTTCDTAEAQATKDAAYAALLAAVTGMQTLLSEPAALAVLSLANSTGD